MNVLHSHKLEFFKKVSLKCYNCSEKGAKQLSHNYSNGIFLHITGSEDIIGCILGDS